MNYGGDRYWQQTYHTSGLFSGEEYMPQHCRFPPSAPGGLTDYQYRLRPSSSEQIPYNTLKPHYSRSYDDQRGFAPTQAQPVVSVLAPLVLSPEEEKQLQSRQKRISPFNPSITDVPPAAISHEGAAGVNSNPPIYPTQAPLPIAIPQMSKGRGVPFQRLYAPTLQEYGISEPVLVEFIDRLNLVSAASPPLKVLDLAGGVVGIIPHHWAQLTSSLMQLAAKGGTKLVTKNRTEAFLSEANENIFGPRRLRVRLVTSNALLATINFPQEKSIALPLNTDIPSEQQPTLHTRLLQGLRGYVSETFPTKLLPEGREDNLLDKWSANQVSRDIKAIDRKLMKQSEKKMKHKVEDQQATHRTDCSEEYGTPLQRSRSFEHKTQKIHKNAQKKLDSGKVSVVLVEEERKEKLSKLMDKEESKSKHIRDKKEKHKSKSGADEEFIQKLLWIFIDRLLSVPT